MSSVLDASAFLAYLHGEPGADVVADAIAATACIGAANLAETLAKLADSGPTPRDAVTQLTEIGILDGLVQVEPVTAEDAVAIAELRAATRDAGLSLGDRACLALGARLGLPVVTADRAWAELELGVPVQTIR